MSGRVVRMLAGLPVIGYLLKVAHDFVKLPVLRADLHRESVDLASRLARAGGQIEDQSSRLRVLSDGLSALTETVARLRQAHIQDQETPLAAFQQALVIQQAQLERQHAQADRQEAALAALSERLAPVEAHTATSREQLETLLQRVSDNLSEWVELRRRVQAVDGLLAKTEERTTHDQMVLVRLDDAAAKAQELQSQMNAQEDAFAGVLRRHSRTLAELREAIASLQERSHASNGGMTQLLDSFRDLLTGRRAADEPAIEEVPELPRRFQPAVRLLLGETAPGGRFSFRVAAAASLDADLVADFSELPFAPAAIAEIRAGDLLERCAPKEGRRLLSHWSRLLWTGGALQLTFTDVEAAERTYAGVSSAFGELSRAILSQRGERRKAFNRESVHRLLLELGFQDITEQPDKDPAGHGFRIEIHAKKSGGRALSHGDPGSMSA